MENQESNKSLDIPSNIKTKTEFFKGFGTNELKKTAVMTAITGVLFFISSTISGRIMSSC